MYVPAAVHVVHTAEVTAPAAELYDPAAHAVQPEVLVTKLL